MFREIYEVRLEDRDVELTKEVWDEIRDCARGHKFFILVHLGVHYKYENAQTFYDRPTRFDFKIATEEEKEIKYIYI